jgi:Right handed beta helix region
MKKFSNLVSGLLATALLCVASASPSHAATTVYVSGQAGANDTNACTLASPCRSIGHAVSVAGNGGAVSCLDAGPYLESFTATTSFTLDCDGVVYVSTTGFGIKVQTANAPVVRFRHVIFDGAIGGSAAEAVAITGGSNVVFEDCTVQNFSAEGIFFEPSAAGAHLTITDSIIANNGTGVLIEPPQAAEATAMIERTQITGNGSGITALGTGAILVDVRYSSVASNTTFGIAAAGTGAVTSIVVEHSAVDHNGTGISAGGSAGFVSLNDSTVDWNATGLNTTSGGTIISYRNNLIAGNVSAGATPVSIGQQ